MAGARPELDRPPERAGPASSGALLEIDDDGGRRGSRPLVLVHGLATTRRIWDEVSRGLRENRRVVTLDVPGFGGSPSAGPGFDLATVASRIAEGLAAAGVPSPYDLVGHSLGGGLALSIAAARPADVRRLVLVAPAGLSPIPETPARLLGIAATSALAVRRRLVPLTDLTWGRRLLLTRAAADGARLAPTQVRGIVGASAGATRTAAAFTAIARADLLPLLDAARMPLGLIWGTVDRTVSPCGVERILACRPDARVSMVAAAGHLVMAERPRAFREALEELLRILPR